jgi:hypothetical protein
MIIQITERERRNTRLEAKTPAAGDPDERVGRQILMNVGPVERKISET